MRVGALWVYVLPDQRHALLSWRQKMQMGTQPIHLIQAAFAQR